MVAAFFELGMFAILKVSEPFLDLPVSIVLNTSLFKPNTITNGTVNPVLIILVNLC